MPNKMERALEALDLTPAELARKIGVRPQEIHEEIRNPHEADIDRDPLWIAVREYIDKRLAGVLAVRADINAHVDRRQKAREAVWKRIAGR